MRSPAALLLLAALAAPMSADTVYLVNGNRFEEVVVERALGEVRIRMSAGEIVLPDKVVARVERSPSTWQEYNERHDALRAAAATARQWLELAWWAEAAGYEPGMKQSLLRAAAIDPRLDGLAPLMGRIGHVLDRESGGWLAEAAYMRRRGYRQWGGHWLASTEYETRRRAHEEAETRRRDNERQERVARAIEALAVAQLSRAAEPAPEPLPARNRAPLVAVYSGSYFPWLAAPVVSRPDQTTYEDLANRQPGSLLPIRPRRHLTSVE